MPSRHQQKKQSTLRNNIKNVYNEGMKFSNLPILEFRNHVSQRGSFSQISTSFFSCAKARAKLSPFANIFMDYLQISALIMEAIYFLSRKHGSLKLFFYHFHAHLRNKFFCFLTFNFYLFFPPRVPFKNVGLVHFQLLRIFPRNLLKVFVYREEVGTV